MTHLKLGPNFVSLLIGFLAIFTVPGAFSQTVPGGCGELRSPGQYGPLDARKDHGSMAIVLGAHFTPEIELLIRGKTGSLGGEIGYTLRAIPNYHRALIAMMRLAEKLKNPQPFGAGYTVECWFQRAITFAPNDAIVRMIYSTYLNSQGNIQDANAQLDIATGYAKDNAFTHYNIGLHYFDLKNYDKALIQAHKAMALGFTQTELKDQLRSVGKWAEPTDFPVPPAPAASAPTEQAK